MSRSRPRDPRDDPRNSDSESDSSSSEEGGFDFVKDDYLSPPELTDLYLEHWYAQQWAKHLQVPHRVGVTSDGSGVFVYLEQPGEDLPFYMPVVQSDKKPASEESIDDSEDAGTSTTASMTQGDRDSEVAEATMTEGESSTEVAGLLKEPEKEEEIQFGEESAASSSKPSRSAVRWKNKNESSLIGSQPSLAIAASSEQLVTCEADISLAAFEPQPICFPTIDKNSEHPPSGISEEVDTGDYDYEQPNMADEATPGCSHFTAENQQQPDTNDDVVTDAECEELFERMGVGSHPETSQTTPVPSTSPALIDFDEIIEFEPNSVYAMEEQEEDVPINLTTFEIQTPRRWQALDDEDPVPDT